MTSELTKAHTAFIKEVNTIGKDGEAQFGKHATLQGVLGVINPSLSRQGLSVHQVFDYTEDGKTVYMAGPNHDAVMKRHKAIIKDK